VVVLWLAILWVMQAMAQVLFKYGAQFPERKALFFILGNIPGASSTLLFIQLYRTMNPNLALALCAGGGFLACQMALAVVFRSSISLPQYGAMAMISAGMFLFTVSGRP